MGEEGVSVATAVAGEEDASPPVAVAGNGEDEGMVLATAAADLDPVAAAAVAASASLEGLISPELAIGGGGAALECSPELDEKRGALEEE